MAAPLALPLLLRCAVELTSPVASLLRPILTATFAASGLVLPAYFYIALWHFALNAVARRTGVAGDGGSARNGIRARCG